jgi:lipopolysaccharide export system permease protein
MRIKRYILTSLVEVFLGTIAVLYGVMLIVQWIRTGGLISFKDIDVLLLAMVPMSVFVIPMGLLFSILMVLERLSIESEIIAMKACGVKSRTIFAPIIILSIVAMLTHGLISTYVGPMSMKRIQSQLVQEAPQRIFAFLKERDFDDTFKGIIIYVESVNQKKRQFKGVFIETSGKEHAVITSEKGTIEVTPAAIMMKLKNGSVFMSTKSVDRCLTFDEYIFSLQVDLSNQLRIRPYDTASPHEFRKLLKKDPEPKWIKEYHNRFSFPVFNLILGLIGISFGIQRPRSPQYTGFIIGLGTVIGYYFVFVLADRLVKANIIAPMLGAWLPNIVFLAVLACLWVWRGLSRREGRG